MADTITIYGQDLKIKEYNGQRVVTFKDIDTVHNRPDGTARKRFNDNKDRFIESVDFYKVKCSEVRPFFGQTSPNGFNPNADLVLITESGYLMLVKSFTDDLAWIVQRELVNCYFRVKQDNAVQEYKPTRPITTDDYIDAGKTISKCENRRLPIVLDMFRKAGLDVAKIEDSNEDANAMSKETEDINIAELLSKFTLKELCDLLGLAKSTIYYYRTGKVYPRQERKEFIITTLTTLTEKH